MTVASGSEMRPILELVMRCGAPRRPDFALP